MAELETLKAQGHSLTFGQKAVGITFNPGNSDNVTEAKKLYSYVIDMLDGLRNTTDNPEVKRMCSVAITEAQTSQMWAVKAITWQY